MKDDKLYIKSDDLLREKFDDAIEAPSDFVWEKIEQKLDAPKTKRRFLFWFICLLPIVLCFVLMPFYNAIIIDSKGVQTTKNNDNNINSASKNSSQAMDDSQLLDANNSNVKIIDKAFVDTPNNDTNKKDISRNKTIKQKILNQSNSLNEKSIDIGLNNKKEFLERKIKYLKKVDKSTELYNFKNAKSYVDLTQLKKEFFPKTLVENKTEIDFIKPISSTVNNFTVIETENVTIPIKNDSSIAQKKADSSQKTLPEIIQNKKKIKEHFLCVFTTTSLPNNQFQTSATNLDFLNERGKICWGIGANYGFTIGKMFVAKVGVGYEYLKFGLDNTPLTFNRFITQPYIFNTSLGNFSVDPSIMKDGFNPPSPTFPSQFKINYNYTHSIRYLNIPLNIGYKIVNGKVAITAFAGLHTQFLLSKKTTLVLVKERMNNTINYSDFETKKINFATNFSLHISFPTTNKWLFYIEPTTSFLLNSYNKTPLVGTKTSSIGLILGAQLQL